MKRSNLQWSGVAASAQVPLIRRPHGSRSYHDRAAGLRGCETEARERAASSEHAACGGGGVSQPPSPSMSVGEPPQLLLGAPGRARAVGRQQLVGRQAAAGSGVCVLPCAAGSAASGGHAHEGHVHEGPGAAAGGATDQHQYVHSSWRGQVTRRLAPKCSSNTRNFIFLIMTLWRGAQWPFVIGDENPLF